MKITGFGTISNTSSTNKRRGVTGTGAFADLLSAAEAGLDGISQTHDVAATSALNNLLALQEISEEDIHRKKLVQQGNNMLDTLEQLRRQLLVGSLPPQVLLDISRQISLQKQAVSDPRLGAIIDEIELRAAVELAKIEKAIEDKNV